MVLKLLLLVVLLWFLNPLTTHTWRGRQPLGSARDHQHLVILALHFPASPSLAEKALEARLFTQNECLKVFSFLGRPGLLSFKSQESNSPSPPSSAFLCLKPFLGPQSLEKNKRKGKGGEK